MLIAFFFAFFFYCPFARSWNIKQLSHTHVHLYTHTAYSPVTYACVLCIYNFYVQIWHDIFSCKFIRVCYCWGWEIICIKCCSIYLTSFEILRSCFDFVLWGFFFNTRFVHPNAALINYECLHSCSTHILSRISIVYT